MMENVPTHNFLTIPGDFNAKLGPDNAKFTSHTETNRNGELLISWRNSISFLQTQNSWIEKQVMEFEYPNGAKAQLDYVLIRRKWKIA